MRDLRLLLFSALLLLLTVTVVAEPPNGNDDDDGNTPRHGCLGDHEADLILKRFISFFIKPDPVVINKTLTVNFQLFSDSTNFFLGLNVGAVTSNGRANFTRDEITQTTCTTKPCPPPAVFTVLDTVHTCDVIVFRWRLNTTPIPTTGIDYITVEKKSHLIEKDYSEFNVGAGLVNAGCTFNCPNH